MPKQRIDLDGVVAQAIVVVDEAGLDELSLARVASDLGVQASALYNHVSGLDGLREAVAGRAADNLAACLRDAAVGRSADDALRAVALAYRKFAATHPGQYASTLLPGRESNDNGNVNGTSDTGAQASIVAVLARILEGYGLRGDDAVHTARIVRSAIHGFVALEASASFPSAEDPDDSYGALIDFVTSGVHALDRDLDR